MKVPPIKTCCIDEFQKLPRNEQFKYKVSGMLREHVRKEYGILTEPQNEYQSFGNLWASISNILKEKFSGRKQ